MRNSNDEENMEKNTVANETDFYLKTARLDRKADPYKWWSANEKQYPNLSKFAKVYLSSPGSSVHSESFERISNFVFIISLKGWKTLINNVSDDRNASEAGEYIFRTPILRKRWYEIGVLAIRVSNSTAERNGTRDPNDVDFEECRLINAEKSIVDSGTTGIRMPDAVFRRVVGELRSSARTSNTLVLDEFWYHGEAACWPEPQEWNLPSLAVDILGSEADDRFFTLEIPAQSFMRVISARNKSASSGSVSEFCYKLGLEAAPGTVLGYTAMEGLQVLFNRSAGWIGWRESSCGPAARTSGPWNASGSLLSSCGLDRSLPDVNVSIKAAQWTLCAISVVAGAVLVYLLAPCIKMFPVRRLPRSQQISLSQAALVERDTT
ncbi:unnamed protein product [Pieris macdunnoughi]|uniref:HAT C-terminal dimerisation domain-containing protein n=1 Tax=Pieris macdunnoughi TaxID=345717 RepID=A0A821YBH9_9NEOP|nr:unnamed protein product [Pieris macdunnoughi]